ncbi:MAG: acyl-CoA thioesterase II [Variovorax sp.]
MLEPSPESTGHAAQAALPAAERQALVDGLVALLRVTPSGVDRFRGDSEDLGYPNVYGGQVLGQAVMAASQTLPKRPIHSLHAYFLRPGDPRQPIEYAVERLRDGRSFSTRRISASQEGRVILEMMASFQDSAEGLDHQRAMPPAPGPEGVPCEPAPRRAVAARGRERPIEFRWLDAPALGDRQPGPAAARIWMRPVAALPNDRTLHAALLAYASDHGLLRAAMLPHGLTYTTPGMRGASLDHALWFHRDARFDDWLLHDIESPSAQSARGLCRSEIFSRDGRLVASAAQEGMMRFRAPSADHESRQ